MKTINIDRSLGSWFDILFGIINLYSCLMKKTWQKIILDTLVGVVGFSFLDIQQKGTFFNETCAWNSVPLRHPKCYSHFCVSIYNLTYSNTKPITLRACLKKQFCSQSYCSLTLENIFTNHLWAYNCIVFTTPAAVGQ